MDQVNQSFENPIDIGGVEESQNRYVDVVIVVAPKITKDAKEDIRNKVRLGTRNVIFLDGFDLISRIYSYNTELLDKFLGDE